MQLKTITANTVNPTTISWLWPNRIARGKVTLLAGDPGLGKSFVTVDIAARCTLGAELGGDWPDCPAPLAAPGDVVFMSAEDDPADTIVPRLIASGADLSRVKFVEGVDRENRRSMGSVELNRDIDALERLLKQCERPRLVVIDPISAYLGQADGNSNTDVRAILSQLSRVAASTGAAMLCVTHLSKNGAQQGGANKIVYRAMGSLAFTAAARMVWYISGHPDDPNVRAMTLVKTNISGPTTGMTYTIENMESGVATIRWLDTNVQMTAEEIESACNSGENSESCAVNDAQEFLREMLKDGPKAASQVLAEAAENGISQAAVRRARSTVKIVIRRRGNQKSGQTWIWSLPAAA